MRLQVPPPFHLEATVRLLQRLPTNVVDRWDGRRWTRVFPLGKSFALASVENHGTTRAPDVRLAVEGARPSRGQLADLGATIGRMLGFERDPRPFARVARFLEGARPVIVRLAGMRPPTYPTLIEAFANAVAFQQVSLASGTAIVGRLVERFGGALEVGGEWRHAFPEASDLAAARVPALMAVGLSRTKALTLRNAARAIVAGTLSPAALDVLATDAAIERLEALPGIGPWSARLILLRGLGRLDAFPVGDVGVLRGLSPRLQAAAGKTPAHEVLAASLGDVRGYLYFTALALRLVDRGLMTLPGRAPPARGSRRAPADRA